MMDAKRMAADSLGNFEEFHPEAARFFRAARHIGWDMGVLSAVLVRLNGQWTIYRAATYLGVAAMSGVPAQVETENLKAFQTPLHSLGLSGLDVYRMMREGRLMLPDAEYDFPSAEASGSAGEF